VFFVSADDKGLAASPPVSADPKGLKVAVFSAIWEELVNADGKALSGLGRHGWGWQRVITEVYNMSVNCCQRKLSL
jgi:hypothetical protein